MGYDTILSKGTDRSNLIIGTEHNTMYYYQLKDNQLLLLGHENPTSLLHYTQPVVAASYPTNYKETYKNDYQSKGIYSGRIQFDTKGNITTKADAYGAIILPTGDTLNHVLRIKTVQTISEIIRSINPAMNDSLKMEVETYKWYSKGYRYPIFETVKAINTTDSLNRQEYQTAFFFPPQEHLYLDDDKDNLAVLDSLWDIEHNNNIDNTITNPGTNTKLSYNFYPNPVESQLTIEYYLEKLAEVTTPDGTAYIFDQREYHQAQNISQAQSKQISTWYLSEIRTINGNRISFQYNVQKIYSFSLSGISQQYGAKGSNTPSLETSQPYNYASFYDIVTLTNITFPNGVISFDYRYDRKDQPYEPRLQSLIVKNSQNNEIIKQVGFNYDYFQANTSGNEVITIGRIKEIIGDWGNHPFYKAISDDWNKFRLKLTGIDFVGGDKKEIYQFKYNEKSLPTKLSTGRDHWGYYNGKPNSHLIPNQQFKNSLRSIESIEGGLTYYPADREVDPNYSQAFILNEIIYPTGGKTNFDFESNRYNTAIFDGDPLRVNYLYAKKM